MARLRAMTIGTQLSDGVFKYANGLPNTVFLSVNGEIKEYAEGDPFLETLGARSRERS